VGGQRNLNRNNSARGLVYGHRPNPGRCTVLELAAELAGMAWSPAGRELVETLPDDGFERIAARHLFDPPLGAGIDAVHQISPRLVPAFASQFESDIDQRSLEALQIIDHNVLLVSANERGL
jgi:hypothetical protein